MRARTLIWTLLILCVPLGREESHQSRAQEDARDSATTGVEYQAGELVEVNMFKKWIPARIMERAPNGLYAVRFQHEGRRQQVNLQAAKIRRTGATPIIPWTELRTWADASGKHKIQARLLSATEELTTLLKADGKQVQVSMDKLSASDRRLVRRLIQSHAERDADGAGGRDGDLAVSEGTADADPRRRGEGLPPPPVVADDSGPRPGEKGSELAGSEGPDMEASRRESGENGEIAITPTTNEPEPPPPAADPPLKSFDPAQLTAVPLAPDAAWSHEPQPVTAPSFAPMSLSLSTPSTSGANQVSDILMSPVGNRALIGWSNGGDQATVAEIVDLTSNQESGSVTLNPPQTLLAIDAEGKRLATRVQRNDGVEAIGIWDLTTTPAQRIFDVAPTGGGALLAACFAGANRLLLLTDSAVVCLELKGDAVTEKFKVEGTATELAVSPDQAALAILQDGMIYLLAVETGKTLGRIGEDGFLATGMAFDDVGARLAIAGGLGAKVWDLASGDLQTSVELTEPARGNGLIWTSDHHLLIAQSALYDVEANQFAGNYQTETPHEMGALLGLGGLVYFGFASGNGEEHRILSAQVPPPEGSEGSGGDPTQVRTLGLEGITVADGGAGGEAGERSSRERP